MSLQPKRSQDRVDLRSRIAEPQISVEIHNHTTTTTTRIVTICLPGRKSMQEARSATFLCSIKECLNGLVQSMMLPIPTTSIIDY